MSSTWKQQVQLVQLRCDMGPPAPQELFAWLYCATYSFQILFKGHLTQSALQMWEDQGLKDWAQQLTYRDTAEVEHDMERGVLGTDTGDVESGSHI